MTSEEKDKLIHHTVPRNEIPYYLQKLKRNWNVLSDFERDAVNKAENESLSEIGISMRSDNAIMDICLNHFDEIID